MQPSGMPPRLPVVQPLRARAPRVRRTLIALAACAATALATTPAGAQVPVGAVAGPVSTAQSDDPGWQVVDLGNGSYQVSWTARQDLPLGSDRPTITGDGLSFGAPTIAADGRTVTAVVTTDSAPVPRELDVVLSGDRLDEAGFDPSASGTSGTFPGRITSELDAADPGTPGPYATTTSDYDWEPVLLPGMREPIEMVGHVVEPAPGEDTGPRPLVLFMHGRHSVCYNPDDPNGGDDGTWPCRAPLAEIPSHLGYDYIQQILASQGYTTVSVRVNGINAQDYALADGGADARAAIVQEHLDRWIDLAAAHQVDLDQVVLVGHSRGGEGVDRASIQIPASAPYRIAGQVLLAPTDFAWHTAPYVPTVTVLPYCDGDVFDLQGQRFTDVARDLAPGDTSLKSSVMVLGANHNFFNTEWTPATAVAPSWDDWGGDKDGICGRRHPDRLRPSGQRAVGTAYVAGAVHLFTGDDEYAPLFDGSPVTVASIGDADVLSHAIGGGRSIRRPGPDARPTIATGNADVRLCRGVSSYSSGSFAICGRRNQELLTPHWPMQGEQVPTRKFLEFSWQEQGAAGGLAFAAPLDLSAERLELRTLLDPSHDAPEIQVRISDSAGGSALLDPVPGTELAALPTIPGATKLWATTVVVDVQEATGVDLADITSVEVVSGSPEGRVWIADLAAAPAAPPAAPNQRLPRVSIGDVRIDEGSGGTTLARVPFAIAGTVTSPSRFAVFTAGQQRGQTQRLIVDVAPGQSSGYIPMEYDADDVFGFDQQTQVALWPLQGIATDDYIGGLTVVDDDPVPTFEVTVTRTVREGQRIEFTITRHGSTSVPFYAFGRAVRTRGTDLRGADVPLPWLEEHADASDPRRPLWRLYAGVYDGFPPRKETITLTIPIRKDGRDEGREFLGIKLEVGDLRERFRIRVLDSD
jgi:dienelactone hydrolase